MAKEEDWEEYHKAFPESDLEGLTRGDEEYYQVLRATKIEDFGDSLVRPERVADEQVLGAESAIRAANEMAKEARGKALVMSKEIRTLRRQLHVYEDSLKRIARKERIERSVQETILDRLPPQNLPAETTLLGLYLKAPGMMVHFNQPYINLMFYADANKRIHAAMMDLKGKFDLRTLEGRLKEKGEFEAIGGSAYLYSVEACGQTASPELSENYIRMIEDCYLQRQIIHWCSERMRDCWDPTTLQEDKTDVNSWPEYIRRKAADMLTLLPFRFRKSFDTSTLVDEVVEDFRELVKRKGKPKVSTGYKGLDRIMHGVLPGRLVMVGARTKIGKTTFALALADNIAEQHYGTLVFTYECSRAELIQKLISKHSGVDSSRFVYWDEGSIPEEEIDKITTAAGFVKTLPIDFDANKPSIDYILERTRHVKTMKPDLALIVVDGLQSFEGYLPYQGNKSDIYQEILKRLKALAVEQEVCVLVNAQLKLDVEQKPKIYKLKRPKGLEDFSDCKGIPEVADTALCLYRPEFYWPENEHYNGWMEVIPMAMRVGDKREKGFRLGVDMRTSRVYEIEK